MVNSSGTISLLEGYLNLHNTMNKSQRVQQEVPNAEVPSPNSKETKSKLNPALDFFLRLIAYHPWLLVVALLATFAGSAVLAVYSLGYAGRVEKIEPSSTEQTETEVEVVEPLPPATTSNNPLPLWMVFGIAISCAGGCLVIVRWLNRGTNPQSSQKQINRYQKRQAQRRYQASEINTFNQPRGFIEPRVLKNPPIFVPPASKALISPPVRKNKTMVTILPSPQKTYFRSGNESLADSLDLRKQSSVSTILRKY